MLEKQETTKEAEKIVIILPHPTPVLGCLPLGGLSLLELLM